MHKLVIAAGFALAASLVHAQPAPPSPTGLVVGSGNFSQPPLPVTDVLALPRGTQWRYSTVTVPPSGLPIELIEFQGNHRPRPFNIADPGATRIQLRVADIDAAAAALVDAGGTFISTGGRPVDLPAGQQTVEAGIVRDPDGLFVVLIDSPPSQ